MIIKLVVFCKKNIKMNIHITYVTILILITYLYAFIAGFSYVIYILNLNAAYKVAIPEVQKELRKLYKVVFERCLLWPMNLFSDDVLLDEPVYIDFDSFALKGLNVTGAEDLQRLTREILRNQI